jgi:AcrR family transcriptional regulator
MPRLKAPQRRDQLIAVATRLFARHGFRATTTASIAHAAGVTEPILYRHFRGKHELFVAIVRSVSDRTMRHWQEMTAALPDAAHQIRAIGQEFPAHVAKLSDEYHVLHGALALSHDRKVQAVLREHYLRIESFFASLVALGQQGGIFRRDVSPKAAAWQLIMAGIGYAMVHLNLSLVETAISREAIDAIVRGLRA